MYAFVSHTFNTVKGKCSHDCSYCFMKQYGEQKPVRLDEKELFTDLGEGNFIFIGSSCDMWADDIPGDWIKATLGFCRLRDNKYLFQTKNPKRFFEFAGHLPKEHILGTTIESNRIWPEMGKTPTPQSRAETMGLLSLNHKTMITIEPIMEFDLTALLDLVYHCDPEWVVVGADSKGNDLPEPKAMRIKSLIEELECNGITVVIKKNLNRLMGLVQK